MGILLRLVLVLGVGIAVGQDISKMFTPENIKKMVDGGADIPQILKKFNVPGADQISTFAKTMDFKKMSQSITGMMSSMDPSKIMSIMKGLDMQKWTEMWDPNKLMDLVTKLAAKAKERRLLKKEQEAQKQ